MKNVKLSSIYDTDEDRQLARILSILIWASWGVYLFVIISGVYYHDWRVIAVTLAGCALQIVPLILLKRRHLFASSLLVMLMVLITVTIIATIGQGIRDLAIVIFPIVLIFAGLTLNRKYFKLCVGLTILAVFWLVFGEYYGWFVTQPLRADMTNWFYLIGTTLILLVGALAVDLLSSNMRKSLELARLEIIQRKSVEEQLRYQGMHDELTNIYSRSFFIEELSRLENSREYPISVIMADVDDLKDVNDNEGHFAGDALLCQVAMVLHSVFRESEVLARIGGDEFAVLLPGTKSDVAEQMLMRVKERLAKNNHEHPELTIHLSLGAATAEKDNLIDVFKIADQRMYADKALHKSNSISSQT